MSERPAEPPGHLRTITPRVNPSGTYTRALALYLSNSRTVAELQTALDGDPNLALTVSSPSLRGYV